MRKKWIIGIVVLLILLLGVGGVVYFQYQKKLRNDKIELIKSHYDEWVILEKDTSLYGCANGNYHEIGSASNGMKFALEVAEIQEEHQEYFQIKDTPYYVYYEDVLPTEYLEETKYPSYYLFSKDQIQSKERTNFYQDGKLVFSIDNSMKFSYVIEEPEFYQISYLNRIFSLKKEEVELEKSEESLEISNYVSVLEFQEIKDSCNQDSCITPEKLREFLKLIQDSGMYSITATDYELWVQGYSFLQKGAMLFHLAKYSENVEAIFEEFGYSTVGCDTFKYSLNNQTSQVGTKLDVINSYSVHQNTTTDQMKQMISGTAVVIPKPVAEVKPKGLPGMDAKATNIAVLNYHFFYGDGESCGGSICLHVDKFREQLEYLKENHYKTLTMEEYRAWMYGEIELPARSVLITIDDGAKGTGKHNGNKLIPLLEEYDMHATLFLISGWWAKDNYLSDHLDIESHTYDMHTEGLCSNQTRGAQMLCSSKEQVMADLQKSIATIGSNIAFCFPFYAYNDSAIQSVKESGFQLAFIGGNRKSNRSNDKFKIPRYPIYSNTTLNQFINMIA